MTALSWTKSAQLPWTKRNIVGSVAWSILADSSVGEPNAETVSADDQKRVVDRLLALCDHYQIPGTWFFARPSSDAAVERIVCHSTRHAIGLTIDSTLASGRTEFAKRLRREQAILERRQIGLHALQVASTAANQHYDLLIKHGISIVNHLSTSNSARAVEAMNGSLRQLRHGLWTMPTATATTAKSMTGSLCAWWRATSTVLSAVDGCKKCHLSIELNQLRRGGIHWTLLAKLMRLQAGLRREGRLQIATAATLADQMSNLRQPAFAARSILRAA